MASDSELSHQFSLELKMACYRVFCCWLLFHVRHAGSKLSVNMLQFREWLCRKRKSQRVLILIKEAAKEKLTRFCSLHCFFSGKAIKYFFFWRCFSLFLNKTHLAFSVHIFSFFFFFLPLKLAGLYKWESCLLLSPILWFLLSKLSVHWFGF